MFQIFAQSMFIATRVSTPGIGKPEVDARPFETSVAQYSQPPLRKNWKALYVSKQRPDNYSRHKPVVSAHRISWTNWVFQFWPRYVRG